MSHGTGQVVYCVLRRLRQSRIGQTLLFWLAAGCDAYTIHGADTEGYRIQHEKQAEVDEFRATKLRRPEDPVISHEAETAPVEVPKVLTLDKAVEIATRCSRDYQSRRESIFLSSLSLGVTRRDFLEPVFSGSISTLFADTRRGPATSTTFATLGATQMLPTGGQLALSTTSAIARTENLGADQSTSLSGTALITQPLLRGAGYKIAYETLTQAERELLYTMRDFELFREQFAIDVISRYYELVSQKQQVDNTRRSVEEQKFVADRAEAFYKVDRLNKIEKLRTDQAYLSAKNQLIDAEQSYKLTLDRFKVFLGLPTESEFDIPDNAQPEFVTVNLDLEAAVQTALQNRLDLLTERDRVEDSERQLEVAKNRMLPDLSLTGSYALSSDASTSFRGLAFSDDAYTVGLNLEIPLNRKSERNAYRAAMITVDQAHRSLRQTEDNLILEVRDSLRRLKQQEQSIDIQKQIVETETTSVRIAEIEYQAGEKSTRDVTEARERLLSAQNSLIEAIVAYEITRLNLLRQLGILFVTPEGMIVK